MECHEPPQLCLWNCSAILLYSARKNFLPSCFLLQRIVHPSPKKWTLSATWVFLFVYEFIINVRTVWFVLVWCFICVFLCMKRNRSPVAGIKHSAKSCCQPPPHFLDNIPCLCNRIPFVDVFILVSAGFLTLMVRICPERWRMILKQTKDLLQMLAGWFTSILHSLFQTYAANKLHIVIAHLDCLHIFVLIFEGKNESYHF